MHFLDFEKDIVEIEGRIAELQQAPDANTGELARLRDKLERGLRGIYAKLTPAQKVQVARHPERPHAIDYINALVDDFTPLAGDRLYGEDRAIVGGLGRFQGQSVVVLGLERGHDTESRLRHNFGMAKPDGYRKAQRLMKLAEHFNLPIITFVDTAGAFPGVDAEARGQAEAIAKSIEVCLSVNVPFVTVVIGEGGSGGAIALATADRVLMLEHAIYSVISPEGCAGILWRSNTFAATAAEALRLTAQDLNTLGVIDEIVPEPVGGAHRDKDAMMQRVGERIAHHLRDIAGQAARTGGNYLNTRAEKFLAMGQRGL
ncbi:MAG: acetyl-CoA carboxylase carboxyltransferase subunit alpha [Bdellovibrionales bacterium]